jgi:hypothetical protein
MLTVLHDHPSTHRVVSSSQKAILDWMGTSRKRSSNPAQSSFTRIITAFDLVN